MLISQYFTYKQLTFDPVATMNGIDNTPKGTALTNLRDLATGFLDKLIIIAPAKIVIVGAYRNAALSKIYKEPYTAHQTGNAVDFYVDNYNLWNVAELIVQHLEFDKLIPEHMSLENPLEGWLHVEFNEYNRKQYIREKE